MSTYDMTKGNILKNLIRFSLPYLMSCFLQTFYGLADLFVIGRFNGAASITAVSVGSQLTHMLTVVIVGLAMGSTVTVSHSVGEGNQKTTAKVIGNTMTVFAVIAVCLTVFLLHAADKSLAILSVPAEAFAEARGYVTICFWGIPFITAYNVLSSIYRGLGDTRHPMYFVMTAGILNVGLDFLLIGPLKMGASGAALATVAAQAVSVLLAMFHLFRAMDIRLCRTDFFPDRKLTGKILRIGIPVAAQDGFIQVSFLVITMIANRRGVEAAAAVGIVEKVISFLFLVPSSMLSAISTICAQNIGAKRYDRSRAALYDGILISVSAGLVFAVVCRFGAPQILRLFAGKEPAVIRLGAQYLRTYSLDCMLAGIHFCFSGYFCACERPLLSFIHNFISILAIRIPGAYFASLYWPETLAPMGLAAPAGSLLSAVICAGMFAVLRKKELRSSPAPSKFKRVSP